MRAGKIILNKIYNEDCIDTMARMPNGLVDLVVTSPPYDNLRTYKGFLLRVHKIIRELYRVVKHGGVVVWVVSDGTRKGSETGTSFSQALYFKSVGFRLHDTMIWIKNGCRFPDINRYYQAFEYMFVFSKGRPKTTRLLMDRKNVSHGRPIHGNQRLPDGSMVPMKNQGRLIPEYGVRWNWWRLPMGKRGMENEHPAVFPESLAKDHILSWSNEEEIVYDPFSGSGTTAKMAWLLGRYYIGSEISEEYCKLAKERLLQERRKLYHGR